MDPATYYTTTLINAAKNLGPVIIFILGGYFFFIKLPFLLMVKVNKENKPKEEETKNPKLESPPEPEAIKKKEREREEERQRQERKRAEREKARAQEEKRQQKKTEFKKETLPLSAAAQLFEIKPGEVLSQSELKKRYYELLRQNHPDKVASLGKEFKELAERRTKEINAAYEELKKKAS